MPNTKDQLDRLDPLVWKITAVAVLGSLMGQVDATVVNVSLSSLAVDLHSSLPTIQWVTSAYLLALALMLPLNGWLVGQLGAMGLSAVGIPSITSAYASVEQEHPPMATTSLNIVQHLGGPTLTILFYFSRMETGYGAAGDRHLQSLYRHLHAAQPHSYPAFGSSTKAARFHRDDETVALR